MARPLADGSRADEVAVLLCMQDRRPAHRLTDHDRAEVVRRMARLGYSDGQVAHAIGAPRRSVLRIRAKLNIQPGVPYGSNKASLIHDFPIRPHHMH